MLLEEIEDDLLAIAELILDETELLDRLLEDKFAERLLEEINTELFDEMDDKLDFGGGLLAKLERLLDILLVLVINELVLVVTELVVISEVLATDELLLGVIGWTLELAGLELDDTGAGLAAALLELFLTTDVEL